MASGQELRQQLESTEQVQTVVKTMKALAAASIHSYREAVASLGGYTETIERGLQVALTSRPPDIVRAAARPSEGLGVILFGSDQGMCGRFNDNVVRHARDELGTRGASSPHLVVVGERPAVALGLAGLRPETTLAVPTSVDGITTLVRSLLLRVQRWRYDDGVDEIVLFYNRLTSAFAYEATTVPFFPVDVGWLQELQARPWPTRVRPSFMGDADRLLAALLEEHFFVVLYRAMAESLAGENASRLEAMQAAEKNIEARLGTLSAEYQRQRQQAITGELLDIVAGYEVLTEE